MGFDVRSQSWVGSQGSRDRRPVRVQIEHFTNALDNEEEYARLANLNTYIERVAALVQRHFPMPAIFIHRNRATKAPAFGHFHTGCGVGGEKVQRSFPVVG